MLMTPTGSTSNPWPVFTFQAQDTDSGIEYYQIQLDGGGWVGPVSSPYAFSNALSDGEHLIEVKAVDRVGNESVVQLNTANFIPNIRGVGPIDTNNQVNTDGGIYNSLVNQYTKVNFESETPDSPFQSYFEKNQETVSGSSGMLNVSAVDLELPGRNGLDLIIKRRYSSAEVINIGNYSIHKTTEIRNVLINTFNDGW